tara:strand:+ start:168 stop:497 length:330 start_codon:yes stop_codon:yes gene_type:complete
MTFFQSEQVQTDLQSIFDTYQYVAHKTAQLGTMKQVDKLEHIEDCKNLIDKQRTFYTRLSLSATGDPEAADMKQRINALTNAFGYKDMFECLDAMLDTLDKAARNEISE